MLEITDHGNVREIRLARPPVNALNSALLQSLEQAVITAESDSTSAAGPRVIVLSGAAGMFSAGLDVREMNSGEAAVRELVLAFARAQLAVVRSRLPIIAAITGHSPAGGAVLALLCDHRIMAEGKFRIGLNEVQVGLYPGELIFRVLERVVGTQRAVSWLPRGALVSGAEALAAGFVDELVEPTQVVPRSLALAAEIAALPPKVYARTRALVRRDLLRLFEAPPESLELLMEEGWVTDETRERMAKLLAPRAG